MDIKTYTQLNIHTRHILHSYKAYVDGYKNLHKARHMLMDIRHILHSHGYKNLHKLNIHTRHKAYVDGYKNLHTTKYTHKIYLAFI